ncbi:hypothetical protein [Amycolatopsis thermophila]|uniref:Enoyl-[acyl-carrier-protein] reductase (NADH) n=1 Tax=Amycolatopsis thermophila TaxID=206084 RepID=A0ABU0ES31_9PSEU|nr:hypothetical protein [Amycolatopsis thermophila]MDQ0378088.1 enoyl-[acyl-carrier-protein] reductase (NADH) [Amycolatopsis thermophila]
MTDDANGVAAQVADVFGGEQQLNTMNADAKRMLAEAQAGNWAVDEETGSHLRRAVEQMRTELGRISPKIYRLQQAPKLGNDSYAKQVAVHFLTAMDSDDQSLVQVYRAAREMLETLHEAIDIAISKYDASNEAATDALSRFKNQETR